MMTQPKQQDSTDQSIHTQDHHKKASEHHDHKSAAHHTHTAQGHSIQANEHEGSE